MGNKERFSGSHDPAAYRLHRKRFAGGAGTYPLVGTPDRIAGELARIAGKPATEGDSGGIAIANPATRPVRKLLTEGHATRGRSPSPGGSGW